MTKWYSTVYYMFNYCLCTSSLIFTDGKCNKFFFRVITGDLYHS